MKSKECRGEDDGGGCVGGESESLVPLKDPFRLNRTTKKGEVVRPRPCSAVVLPDGYPARPTTSGIGAPTSNRATRAFEGEFIVPIAIGPSCACNLTLADKGHFDITNGPIG